MQRPLAAIEKGSRQKCLLCPIRLVCCGDRRRNASGRLEAIPIIKATCERLARGGAPLRCGSLAWA